MINQLKEILFYLNQQRDNAEVEPVNSSNSNYHQLSLWVCIIGWDNPLSVVIYYVSNRVAFVTILLSSLSNWFLFINRTSFSLHLQTNLNRQFFPWTIWPLLQATVSLWSPDNIYSKADLDDQTFTSLVTLKKLSENFLFPFIAYVHLDMLLNFTKIWKSKAVSIVRSTCVCKHFKSRLL